MACGRMRRAAWAWGLPVAVLGFGCTTDLRAPKQLHDQGRFEAAAEAVVQVRAEPQDTLWVRLEQGKILQDAGRFEESNRAFEEAYAIRESLDDSAVISTTGAINNALIFVTDDRALDYEGTVVDRILMRLGVVVNHLLLGQIDLAAVVARSLDREQQQVREELEADSANRRRAIEEGAKSKGLVVDANSIESNATYRQAQSDLDAIASSSRNAMAVPGAGFPAWVAFMADRSPDQAEGALTWLAEGPIPASLVQALQRRTSAGSLGEDVYVYFEQGLAPERIDGSIGFAVAPGVRIPKVALPKLRSRSLATPARLSIEAGPELLATEVIGSVEAAIAGEFRDRLIFIWGRPVLIAAFKIGLTVAAAASVEDDNARGLILVGGAIWNTLTMPDLRTWTTLPATQQAAVVPRPSSGRLQVGLGNASPTKREVVLPPGPVFLYARSTGAGALSVRVVALDQRRAAVSEVNP
ncbi:MAG: hypothetical protein ACO3SJ_00715 [Phycisphaerales bacterium]